MIPRSLSLWIFDSNLAREVTIRRIQSKVEQQGGSISLHKIESPAIGRISLHKIESPVIGRIILLMDSYRIEQSIRGYHPDEIVLFGMNEAIKDKLEKYALKRNTYENTRFYYELVNRLQKRQGILYFHNVDTMKQEVLYRFK